MKLGLLACSSNTGLGYQTLTIAEHLNPDKVLVYDISKHNGMPTHHERFYQPRVCDGIPTNQDMEWLVDGMDVIIVCETPLNYHLFEYANQRGVKVIQQLNVEFFDFFKKPHLPRPSLLGMPSEWRQHEIEGLNIAPVIQLPLPVDRKRFPFREIKQCKTFIHIVGRPAIHDRNGTLSFIAAAEILGGQYQYKIYLQPPTDPRAIEYFRPIKQALENASVKIEVVENIEDNTQMYLGGDVLVLPRRYGGLCIPMQEALSCGLPVVMPDISPNYQRLPKDWRCGVRRLTEFEYHTNVIVWEAVVGDLVEKMKQFINDEFMQTANRKANEIADSISWETLKPFYQEVMTNLCEK